MEGMDEVKRQGFAGIGGSEVSDKGGEEEGRKSR